MRDMKEEIKGSIHYVVGTVDDAGESGTLYGGYAEDYEYTSPAGDHYVCCAEIDRKDGKTLELKNFYTVTKYRNKHIGTRLVVMLLNRIFDHNGILFFKKYKELIVRPEPLRSFPEEHYEDMDVDTLMKILFRMGFDIPEDRDNGQAGKEQPAELPETEEEELYKEGQDAEKPGTEGAGTEGAETEEPVLDLDAEEPEELRSEDEQASGEQPGALSEEEEEAEEPEEDTGYLVFKL